jgi:regulator of sigma E protease
MKFVLTLAAFALALGILIIVHEFGHYLVARLCGVKVLRFSIGFGRVLWVHKRGPDQTEWAISAFPLGGYVKMLDEREGVVAPDEVARAFNRQSVYRRIAIVLAGPFANFLLAVLLYWALFMVGVPGLKPVLGDIPPGSPAQEAGLHKGDTILSVAEQDVATWQDLRWRLLKEAVERAPVDLEVRSEGGALSFPQLHLEGLSSEDLEQDFLEKLGLKPYQPELAPKIGKVLPGGPAARAGLMAGDTVLSINGENVTQWSDLVTQVRASPEKALKIVVARGRQMLPIEVVPSGVVEDGQTIGRVGAAPQVDREALQQKLFTEVRYPPLQAMGSALRKTWDTSIFSLEMLVKMVSGAVSWKNLSGPITIADYAGQTAQLGLVPYLSFLALISISLGVLNLLPVPMLDGGHLMYYMVEFIKGSPVSERTMAVGQQIGIAILLTLMAFAFYNDINRLFSGS